jgi:hypothetical protein
MAPFGPVSSWIKALWAQTFLAWWTILSAVSTFSTFFVPSWSGRLRGLFVVSGVVAFAWANFRVFRDKHAELIELQDELAAHNKRLSDLVILEERGSRYILHPVANIQRADFDGLYVEFWLMIENRGLKNSTVISYQVEVVELDRAFSDLRPLEHQNGVQGRNSHFVISRDRTLSSTGNIEIPAERATKRGNLLFHINGITLEQFAAAGMRMNNQDRRFGPLHCRLMITDTTGISASHEFVMPEA